MSILSIEIHKKDNGDFQAHCPELELHCIGASETEAVNRMESLILFELTKRDDSLLPEQNFQQFDGMVSGSKTFYVPPNTRVH